MKINFGDEEEYMYAGKQRPTKFNMTTFNKHQPLKTSPHYSDYRFKEEQTVFGKEQKGLSYEYSDRLRERSYDKDEEATKHANSLNLTFKSCAWYEAYLSHYFDKPVTIYHILAGVNRGNGHPYAVFGYKFQ